MPCGTSNWHPIRRFMIIDRFLAEQSRRRNVPRIFSPIDHVPAHIAWIDALCVQRRRLLSVICIKIMSQSVDGPRIRRVKSGMMRTSPSRP